MTLPLYGTASLSAGFTSHKARSVIRLRSVDTAAERCMADFALARTPDEILRAIEADWPSVFVVADGSIDLPGTFNGRLLAVPQKYDYLADGDVVGFDHASRKFRTLFRRNLPLGQLSPGHPALALGSRPVDAGRTAVSDTD